MKRGYTFGYARVSIKSQNLDLQLDALKKAGCNEIFQEKVSSVKKRPEFNNLLSRLREGDTLIVWKLDRIGRNIKELIQIVQDLAEKGVNFISIIDNIQTDTPQGRLFFHVVSSIAEYERETTRERTYAGLHSARLQGRVGGRKKGLSPIGLKKAKLASNLYKQNEPQLSTEEICSLVQVSRATLYKYLKHQGVVLRNGEQP